MRISYPFNLTINHDLSISDIVEAGNYDSAEDDIVFDEPLPARSGEQELRGVLVSFDNVSKLVAVVMLGKYGFRPGTVRELLALGAQYPNFQCQTQIAALGSTFLTFSKDMVAILYSCDDKRHLHLTPADGEFETVIAFRKEE